MTPSMGMAAPKGAQAPAAPQAGLAALAQPAQAPKGKSPENMGAMMALARKMSDMQLADVLAGKSLDVPQYVAMTEAMGRKQLRTAMQGAQAMGQARQPSLKDKLMAEEAGLNQLAPQMPPMGQTPVMAAEGGLMYGGGGAIDMNETTNSGLAALPAMNMMPMTMADGGIVAFSGADDDQLVEARNPLAFLNPGDLYDKLKGYFKEKQAAVGETPLQAKIREAGAPHPSDVPAPTADQTAAFMGNITPTAATAPSVATAPAAPKKSGIASLLSGESKPTSYDEAKKDYAQEYLASLADLSKKQREGLAQIRKETGGEALMQLAAGLLGRPTLQQGLAAGLPLVASTAAASRKEQREIERTANDYDLNVAKARAALQEGDKDRALKYQQLANEDKYHMAMVNKPDGGIALLNALKDPKMMELYKEMNTAKKPTDVMDRDKAATLWEKMTRNEKKSKYGDDFETYYRTMNNQLLSATIPGQGATTRPY